MVQNTTEVLEGKIVLKRVRLRPYLDFPLYKRVRLSPNLKCMYVSLFAI